MCANLASGRLAIAHRGRLGHDEEAVMVTQKAQREQQPQAEQRTPREQRFERKMSDAEALMWNVEKDPWLNPNGASISVVDRPIELDRIRGRIAYGAAMVPRLRDRVVPGLGRLSPPEWAPDPEFDLDYHIRHVALPPPGTERQLLDLAAQLYQDPYDRSRPLWYFVLIDGLEGGRSALFSKMHHTLADGITGLRLSEMYVDLRRDAPDPPAVDLDAVIAETPADVPSKEGDTFVTAATRSLGHAWRRQLGIARRTAGEVAMWGADPRRPLDLAQGVVQRVQQIRAQATGHDPGSVRGGSPLWTERSRHRHFEALRVPLDDAQATAKQLDGTVNSFFVTGAVIGALAYHDKRDARVDALNISFVVSTRQDKTIGGNAFTPTRLQASGAPMAPDERFRQLHDAMTAKRAEVRGAGLMSSMAGVANLLPTSVVTRVGRSQSAHMDFATSNLRGAPRPLYMCGAKVLQNYPMGPVAGTAFNMTTMSYNGSLDIGLCIDPRAVEDPDDLRRCMEEGYAELIAAGTAG
jgi:WS/DGAT/MGAT family acyltransferase